MTTSRSASVIASTWSCVTNTDVAPSLPCRRRISAASAHAVWRRGSRAVRRRGTPWARAPRPDPWRRADVGRPTARRGRRSSSTPRARGIWRRRLPTLRVARSAAGQTCRTLSGKAMFSRTAHVRVERVVLEHHGAAAFTRLEAVHQPPVDHDVSGGDVLQTGDHAQQGGLAAAGRTQDDHELAGCDLERGVPHDSVLPYRFPTARMEMGAIVQLLTFRWRPGRG